MRNTPRTPQPVRCLWALLAVLIGSGLIVSASEPLALDWTILEDSRWVQKGKRMSPAMAEEMGDTIEPEYVLSYGQPLLDRDGKTVRLRGFMVPLDAAASQTRFLLSKYPLAHCRYCQPGGAVTVVEVRAQQPIEFSFDEVTIDGKLELFEKEELGLRYRMTEAILAKL